MHKKKILIVTGTRAEYGLLKSTINAIIKSRILEPRLVVTGMHTLKEFGYTLNEIKQDKIPISCVVEIKKKDDMLTSFAKEVIGIKKYCLKDRPNLILVLGDRDESFAAAVVGGHLKIPIVHIRGGEVSGYIVDESIRHSITKFAHLHFTISKKSRQRVIKLGEEKQRVFRVGATEFDNLDKLIFIKKEKLAKKINLNNKKKWALVIHHPTPLDDTPIINQVRPLYKVLAQQEDMEVIIIYPNSDTGSHVYINEINQYRKNTKFHIFKNFPRYTYLNILKCSNLLIGNSSSGIIESTYFKKPTINIGNRQKGRERAGNVIDCGYSQTEIKQALNRATSKKFINKCGKIVNPYRMQGNSGERIVNTIEKNINNKKLFFKKFTYAKIK